MILITVEALIGEQPRTRQRRDLIMSLMYGKDKEGPSQSHCNSPQPLTTRDRDRRIRPRLLYFLQGIASKESRDRHHSSFRPRRILFCLRPRRVVCCHTCVPNQLGHQVSRRRGEPSTDRAHEYNASHKLLARCLDYEATEGRDMGI